MMDRKLFWTLNKNGEEVLRDLEEEGKIFTMEGYYEGIFDGNNYMWQEMFNHYLYDDLGCDYERYGCYIREGDTVLDLGGNIGIFAHRAETRGASKVISFEPLSPTFNCLNRNKGPKTEVYKNAVGGESRFAEFRIHSDFTHIGGGSSKEEFLLGRPVIHSEKVFYVNINDIFSSYKNEINFMKIDIEGGEVEVLNSISDHNLNSLRCLAAEFHNINEGFEEFESNFIERMVNTIGFKYFILYHGNGDLRTLNFWK
jgi:FkbM family methyltransferase